MAEQGPPGGHHLPLQPGRQVVFCYACSNEWYNDEGGLACPRCHGDIVQIVTEDDDPREVSPVPHDSDDSPLRRSSRRPGADSDSDPEEADIEEHLRYGPGYVFQRRTFGASPHPDPQADGSGPSGAGQARAGGPRPVNPNDGDEIVRRFLDMVSGFGVAIGGNPAGRNDPWGSPSPRGEPGRWQPPPIPSPLFGGTGGPGNFQRTTIRAGPNGITTFTFASSGPITFGGGPHGGGPGEFPSYAAPPFATLRHRRAGPQVTMMTFRTRSTNQVPRVFGSILNEAGHPPMPGFGPGGLGGGDRPGAAPVPGTLAASLHEILSLLNPANATHGDAVYTQEALDRIITALMEQNPQSNAAPPATEAALSRLERKKVDAKMLQPEGRVECTICIDEMKEGEEVVLLPCKHWFHDQCVVMWLKEHNTCPICRSPIEASPNAAPDPNSPANSGSNNNNNANAGGPGGLFGARPDGRAPPSFFGPGASYSGYGDSPGAGNSDPSRRRDRYFRNSSTTSPTGASSRLSEVIRNLSGPDADRDRGTGANSSGYQAPPGAFDPSRHPPRPRRDSMSPPSPHHSSSAQGSSRTRQRSPTPSHGDHYHRRMSGHADSRSGGDRQDSSGSARQGSSTSTNSRGPLGWLRDHLGGGGSNRERRRS